MQNGIGPIPNGHPMIEIFSPVCWIRPILYGYSMVEHKLSGVQLPDIFNLHDGPVGYRNIQPPSPAGCRLPPSLICSRHEYICNTAHFK